MAIFNSYVSLPEGNYIAILFLPPLFGCPSVPLGPGRSPRGTSGSTAFVVAEDTSGRHGRHTLGGGQGSLFGEGEAPRC